MFTVFFHPHSCSKSKKEGKQESKWEKESEIERAKANAALWETRLGITETSRLEYREAARRLARANEELTNHQYRAEKETVDIIAFLKKKEAEKEAKVMLSFHTTTLTWKHC